jgi:hypothetical protein
MGVNADGDSLVAFPARDVGFAELHVFLRSLEAHGVLDRVLVACPAHYFKVHPGPQPLHVDEDFRDPGRAVDRILDRASAAGRSIAGVIGVDEDLQFGLSGALAARAGAPFHSDDACVRASNKFVQKTWFRREGVPTSAFALAGDPSDADEVGFPCVVKAVTSYASQYMGRCDDRPQLAATLERLRGAAGRAGDDPRFRPQTVSIGGETLRLDPRRDFLVEAFVRGEEYSCDFQDSGGEVHVVRVARKVQGPRFGFFDGAILLGRHDIDRCGVGLDRLTDVCRRIASALAVREGVCMVDFRLPGGEIVVLEASIRPGLSATNHLVFETYGYTPLALLAMLLMGRAPEVRIPDEGAAVVYLNEGGRTWDARAVAALRERHGGDRVYVYDRSEDAGPIPENDPSALIRGYVVVTGVADLDWEAVVERALGGIGT